jgi:predicted nucleic acid-binding protein
MERIVVIDASLAVMWAIPENYSARAFMLAETWSEEETRLLAPCLLLTEVINALYKRIIRKELDLPKVQEALEVILAFGIEIHEEAGLHTLALDLSLQLGQPATYDVHYLALTLMHAPSGQETDAFIMWPGNHFPRFIGSGKEGRSFSLKIGLINRYNGTIL